MNSIRTILLAAVLGTAAGAAIAQGPKPLEVIAFGGGGNWPVWVAQALMVPSFVLMAIVGFYMCVHLLRLAGGKFK